MSDAQQRKRFMQMALALGRRGQGLTWPNPAVGCVIVNQGRVVGRGWTQAGGRPHAEVVALAEAGDKARGADVYVTLEPCAHHGKTPPCVSALIEAGVRQVFVATGDPDPRTNGKGIAALRDAGIAVTEDVEGAAARHDHAGFMHRVQDGRPLVTLKLAMTVDGRIATPAGESKWITGAAARRKVHMQRSTHDAVLVGAGTVRADDPSLTVRDIGARRQPVRVVLSRGLNFPVPCRLSETMAEAPFWVVHGAGPSADAKAALLEAGVKLMEAPSEAGALDLNATLRLLGSEGLTRVYCEGGGQLAASLLSAGLVDELVVFTAGKLIGADGVSGVAALGLHALADAPNFTLLESAVLGDDVMHRWGRQS